MHWQTLRWPFRVTGLFLVGAYVLVGFAFTAWAAMDFWVGVMVVTLGAPVWYTVIGGLSLYAEKLFTHAASGLVDEPIDRETDVNPFQQGLAVKLSLAHLVVFAILYGTGPGLSPWLLLPALLFPLLWLGILLDDRLLAGFLPRTFARLVGGLNVFYPLAALLASGSVGYLHYTLLYAPSLVNLVLSAFAFLFANTGLGLLLYGRRRALDLHTRRSPEQMLAESLAAEQLALDRLFHDIQMHVKAGSFGTAMAKIESYVAADPANLDPFMHERLLEFRDDRLTLQHAVRYLERLVDRGETRKAWMLLKECLSRDERFRPQRDATLLSLTRSAGREDVGLVNQVLADFEVAYPGSPLIPDAAFRRARVCIELLRDGETGLKLLAGISNDHPDFAASDTFQRYRRRLRVR
jgi:hypothetical protein